MSKPPHATRARGIYVLPSLFTTAGLFAGFYALIAAIQGRFELAAWAVIIAAIFDMFDGRIARLLHAETAFGAEYDSLCDMLSFGVAPAVLLYMWALAPHQTSEILGISISFHKLAWLGGFLIASCSALRLARFNTQVGQADKRYFQGLPTPATALLIATAVLFYEDSGLEPWPWLWLGIAIALAYLMVSGIRFISGKDIDLKKRRPFTVLVLMLAAIVLIGADPYKTLFAVMLVYCLHGPAISIWQLQRASRLRTARHKQRDGKKK